MSKWYYQQDNCLGGPVSFNSLARLVVDNELTGADAVCRSDALEWTPISSVVGLRRKCEVLSGQREYVPPTAAEIAESGVYPVNPEEIRRRARKVARALPTEDSSMSWRELAMWVLLVAAGVGASALLYNELVIGARNQPTYQRSD